MLVFGTYAFPIQTLDSARYGLPAGAKLQLYCKIFHLFWIPFFPTSRMWVLKMNGQKYEPSHQIRQMIERNEMKRSSPFYAYAILLLLAIGVPTGMGMQKFERHQSQKKADENQQNHRRELLSQIDILEQGDALFFKHRPQPAKYGDNGAASAAIVEAVSPDSLLLRTAPDYKPLYTHNYTDFFLNPTNSVSFTWIAKNDLRATIGFEDLSYRSFEGALVSGLYDGREINLQNHKVGTTKQWQAMDHPEGPLSQFRGSK